MQSQIGHGLQGQELEDFLKANADKIETKTYMRYFDKTEAEELKEELSNHMVELNDIEEEQREKNLAFKERKKPLVKRKRKSFVTSK
jgi:S-methylmethionine-dependent homocysteine/selenocysteine methylase